MPSNNSGQVCSEIFRKYPGRLAHLHSADSLRRPKFGLDWSLDNGVFGAFTRGVPWDGTNFYEWLDEFGHLKPNWVVIPDAVGDRDKTLKMWDEHSPSVAQFNVPMAFVAQDGMTPKDVPNNADIVFIGGSTNWKWANLQVFCDAFPNMVHVGRVNTIKNLFRAHHAGAISVDGTGWFRGDQKQLAGLYNYLAETSTTPLVGVDDCF